MRSSSSVVLRVACSRSSDDAADRTSSSRPLQVGGQGLGRMLPGAALAQLLDQAATFLVQSSRLCVMVLGGHPGLFQLCGQALDRGGIRPCCLVVHDKSPSTETVGAIRTLARQTLPLRAPERCIAVNLSEM